MYMANKNKTYTAYLFVYVTEHSLMFRLRFYIWCTSKNVTSF